MKSNSTSLTYLVGGVVLALAGLGWALWGSTSSVQYNVVAGVSVFAVIYLIAQSAERITEFIVNGLHLLPGEQPESKKQEALKRLRTIDTTINANPSAMGIAVLEEKSEEKSEAKKEADAARKDIAFLAGGVSILLCAIGVNALNYGLMRHIGAEGVNADFDRLLTTLAAAGGTKTLHELIGRFEKGKESAEE